MGGGGSGGGGRELGVSAREKGGRGTVLMWRGEDKGER